MYDNTARAGSMIKYIDITSDVVNVTSWHVRYTLQLFYNMLLNFEWEKADTSYAISNRT